nr:hypothetical protein [Kordiimonas marina]
MHATISERTAQIDVRRVELVEAWKGEPSLKEVLTALVLPLAELAETDEAGRNYVLFLSQAISQPDWDLRRAIKDYTLTGLGRTFEQYDRCLSHLPDDERRFKQSIAYDAGVLALKRWCLREAPKQSAQEISDLVIRTTMAILKS